MTGSKASRLIAEEARDPYTKLRAEEVEAKQKHIDELSAQIESTQKQITDERQKVRESQEKLWKDFSQSLEVERKEMKDRLESLDERQRRFETELDKKRTQDELHVTEKENEMKRMMAQLDRLRGEIEIDRKEMEDYKLQQKNAARAAQEAQKGTQKSEGPPSDADAQAGGEVLQNGTIKISGGSGRELMGNTPFHAKKIHAEYYVETGDIFDIEVWRVPDLSRSVSVRPDGRISMPLIGDMDVIGLTLVQVKDQITKKLSEYVRNPQVSISVRQFGGRKFIILGEVKSPGVYRYQQDISLLEGIALAGGFQTNSRRGKIMIIRGDIHKEPQVKIISANLENVLKKGMISENLTILSNDIIFVAKDFLGDYHEILDNMIAPAFDKTVDFFVVRSAIRTAQGKRN